MILMKKIFKNKFVLILLIIILIAGVRYYKNYQKYQSEAHPIPIPENSVLHQLTNIDFGQSEQEVENILGKPNKTYDFKPKCVQGTPYTYKRWTDKVTQASIQLLFNENKQLSLIVLHNGNTLLEMKKIMPQYNLNYTVGSSHLFKLSSSDSSTDSSDIFYDSSMVDENVIEALDRGEYPEISIDIIQQFKKDKVSTGYYFIAPSRTYMGYFSDHITSTSLGITKNTNLFGCQVVADEIAADDYGDNIENRKEVIPLLSILFNYHPTKFESEIRPKPVVLF